MSDAGYVTKDSGSSGGGGSSLLKNPLIYLFKRESSQTSKDKTEPISKQEKGRRKVLEKSVSMMEEFNRQEKITRQQKKDLIKELKSSTKLSSKSSSLTRTRTQPSHLDTSYYSCDEYRATDTPSPPPYPAIPASPSQPSPPDANMKKILSSGLDSLITISIFIVLLFQATITHLTKIQPMNQ